MNAELTETIADTTREYERESTTVLRHHQWHTEMAAHLQSELSKLGYSIVKTKAKASKWHRLLARDGSLWMETSDREEALAEVVKRGLRLQRLWVEIERTEWREETP